MKNIQMILPEWMLALVRIWDTMAVHLYGTKSSCIMRT